MADEKLGVDVILADLDSASDVFATVDGALKDGFQPLTDSMQILPVTLKIPAILATKEQFIAQVNDLSLEERTQINQHFATKFSIENKAAEELVEALIEWIMSTWNVVKKVKALKPAA